MHLSLGTLRQIIREEIGRNMKTNPQLEKPGDYYPWIDQDIDIEIYPDVASDKWFATVETEDGQTIRQSKPSQEEADFWAKEQWRKAQRKQFGTQEKE